jgi:hypothetical protein
MRTSQLLVVLAPPSRQPVDPIPQAGLPIFLVPPAGLPVILVPPALQHVIVAPLARWAPPVEMIVVLASPASRQPVNLKVPQAKLLAPPAGLSVVLEVLSGHLRPGSHLFPINSWSSPQHQLPQENQALS